jgi:hypothetical protein
MEPNSKLAKYMLVAVSKGYRILPDGTPVNKEGKVLATYPVRKYQRFSAHGGSGVFVHKLQAFQKFGDAIFEPNIQVRHKDNNRNNNAADNILLGTPSQNAMDNPPELRRAVAMKGADSQRKYDYRAIAAFYYQCKDKAKTRFEFNIKRRDTLDRILRKCGFAKTPYPYRLPGSPHQFHPNP